MFLVILMIIELDSLFSKHIDQLDIDKDIIFDESFQCSDIKGLKNVHFKASIYENNDSLYKLDGIITGTMVITDSISLDDVDYDFSCKIEENIEEFIENEQNTIDILEFLWQNIVLEVPLSYTEVSDYTSYSGEGWKLISEDEIRSKNPFAELMKNIEKE